MEELISIIIPVYNSRNSIKKCLDSVVNQTYEKLEIIVIDDGSTDDSFYIINEFIKNDTRVIYYRQNHAGASAARNYGLSLSHGEYIGFIDSDDYIDKDMYETLLGALKDYDVDISMCGYNTLKNGIVSKRHCGETFLIMDTIELLKEFFSWNLIGAAVWSKLYKRSVFDNLLFEDYSYKEDAAIMYRILAKCQKGIHIGCPKYNYIIQDNSVYRRPFDPSKMCTVKIINDLIAFIRLEFPCLFQNAVLYSVNTYFELLDDIFRLNEPLNYKDEISTCIRNIESLLETEILESNQRKIIEEKLNVIYIPKTF
ncbi:MAG: glycosyltransferase family 2 protein [Alphaproteobacteria bacterium]|nr:glycosyltransferase family 2 protein [Clostridia bacterium]MBQ7673335.1 glycosyltransferase family 2 protein [Alphaproteobacteria bacterium]